MFNSTDFHLQEREIVVTRTFNAPAQVVFDAMTQPQHVRRWWGPKSIGYTFVACDIDLRPGGKWRYVQLTPDGSEFAFSGEYREIDPPRRAVLTECYEAMPEHGYVVSLLLDEAAGKTKLTASLKYQSNEDRDGHYNSGMAGGMRESWDQLAELVEALAATAV